MELVGRMLSAWRAAGSDGFLCHNPIRLFGEV